MSASYKGMGAKKLAKIPLGSLRTRESFKTDDEPCDSATHIAHLERIDRDQTDEILELRSQLIEEKSKNAALEQNIEDMTNFLADYGLHWVGGPAPKDLTFENGPSDMKLFNQRITELNSLAEQSVMSIKNENGVARIEHPKAISIVLTNSGFTVDNGPIRPYDNPMSASFLRDISDGFFPTEFKADYPDGVRLSLEDRRSTDFQGKGRRLIESARSSSDTRVAPISTGSGRVRVKVPGRQDTVFNVEEQTKLRQIRRLVAQQFDIEEFELCDPVTAAQYKDDDSAKTAGLYPRGAIAVVLK